MKLKRLLNISRPRFWIYEIGPYIIGIVAAAESSISPWISIPVLIFFLFFTYPANIYIYGINDVYDYDTDKLNPKKVSYESLVMPDEQKKLLKHIFLITIPFIFYLYFIDLNYGVIISFFAFLFFAGFYSAKPIRAKTKPILDSIFSAGHYIATGVFSFLLVSHIFSYSINWENILISIIAGICWAMSMHAYSAVPDIKADTDAKLKTIATKLGKNKTIILCAILYTISALFAFKFIGIISILLGLVYVYTMIISINTTDEKLFNIYKKFPMINSIAGMIIFFTILLN